MFILPCILLLLLLVLVLVVVVVIVVVVHCYSQDKMCCFSFPTHINSQAKISVVRTFLNETLIPRLVAIMKRSTLTFVRGTLLKQLE